MALRWLTVLCVSALSVATATAQPAKDPLRFVPAQAELVVKIDRPAERVREFQNHDVFVQAKKLAGVRDFYESTNFQQLEQLIAYFEKELGKDRDQIMNELGANGIVFAAKLTPPGGAMLVVQAKDEKVLRDFIDLALDVLQKELDRQESKDRIVRSKYEGYDIGQVGPKVSFAIADGALVIASEDKVLKLALDAQKKKLRSVLSVDRFAEAQKKAPAKALLWSWLSLEEVRKYPQFKDGLDASSMDPFQMLLFGGFTDLLKRAPYGTASIVREGTGYKLSLAAPVGRTGMAPLKHMIVAPDGASTLPTLLPPRVLSSSSYFLDLGQFWDKRTDILGKKNADGLTDGEKNIAKVLGGIKLGKLFNAMGPHHRLVSAQQKELPYKIKPMTLIPAFALVVDVRDPSFAKDMNSILRSAALLATFQVGLNLREETYKDCEMVSYFFSETKKVDFDPQNIRFNFSPTYVAVGDQFIMSGSADLARDLIDLIKANPKQTPLAASMRTQLFAAGAANLVRANQDSTLTQLILAQALPPNTAKEELRAILDWFARLGTLQLESEYGENDFRYEVTWQPKKK